MWSRLFLSLVICCAALVPLVAATLDQLPLIKPEPGEYHHQVPVHLDSPDPAYRVLYSSDGGPVVAASLVAEHPIQVSRSTTIRARLVDDHGNLGPELVAEYVIDAPQLRVHDTPVISPGAGSHIGEVTVTIASAKAKHSQIHYTLTGIQPTEADPAYAGPFLVAESTVVKARVYGPGYRPSQIAVSAFEILPPGPVPTTLTLPAERVAVPPGTSYQFTAELRDQDGLLISDAPVRFAITGGGDLAEDGSFQAQAERAGPFVLTASIAGLQDTMAVTINHAPDFPPLALRTTVNTSLDFLLFIADGDNDPLTVTVVAQPQHGSLTQLKVTPPNFRYIPETGFNGEDTIEIAVSDGLDTTARVIPILVQRQLPSQEGRLSVLVEAPAFSASSWTGSTSYQEQYLATIHPGRIWHSASPGAAVPPIRPEGSLRRAVAAEGDVVLAVLAAPDAPVSFFVTGEGEFLSNGRNAITVGADADGRAEVTLRAPRGGRIPVLVASPLASGRLRFLVEVQ